MTTTDADLLAALDAGTLDPDTFSHREHVRLAYLLLRTCSPALAIDRFAEGLRRFTQKIGKPEVYHETITWALMLLIHERMAESSSDSFDAFAGANEDLLTNGRRVLSNYYNEETLSSARARTVFVMPDRGSSPRIKRAASADAAVQP